MGWYVYMVWKNEGGWLVYMEEGELGVVYERKKGMNNSGCNAMDQVLQITHDSAHNPQLNTVNLTKMDAQGFECHVLDGMHQILARTKAIQKELAIKWLIGQGCFNVGFLEQFWKGGFLTFSNEQEA